MTEFKIRASAAIQIAAKPRSKTALVSKTSETYCNNWMIEQRFNRKKTISSKYLDKGIEVEDEAIKMLNEKYVKNKKHFEDDFFTGTPDVILPEKIIDVKSSWDVFTFPFFESQIEKAYYLQGQIYMHLTGIHKYELSYCLVDTPEWLIERETANYAYKNGIDADDEVYEMFKKRMTFSDIHEEDRRKTYLFDYDENIINGLIENVINCRKYIKLWKI